MRTALVGMAAAVAVVVSGCGEDDVAGTSSGQDDNTGQTQEPQEPSQDEDTTPEEPSQEPTEPAADPGEATPPGTELSLGETAIVPLEKGSETGNVALTVTAIEEGDNAAFTQKFGDKAAGLAPYYIQITAENVGTVDLSYSSPPRVSAILADGGSTGVSIIGDISGCERESFPSDAGTGTTVESCVLQAAEQGAQLGGAEYDDSDEYRDNPIVWRN